MTAVDNAGQATDARYNALDLAVAVSDANGPVGTCSVARRGADTTNITINNHGNATLAAYDSLGRVSRVDRVMTATGKGNGVRVGADWFGKPLGMFPDTTQCADGLITAQYLYNKNGEFEALIDDNGNKAVWKYDNLGRVVEHAKGYNISPALVDRVDDATTISVSYDADDNIVQMIKEDGTVVDFTVDAGDRVTRIDFAPATTATIGTTRQDFHYDSLGQLLQSIDYNYDGDATDDAYSWFDYDSLGRVVEERQRLGTGSIRAFTRGFDSARLASLMYPDGLTIDYTYHPNGAVKTMDESGAGADKTIAAFEYIGSRTLLRAMRGGTQLDFRNGAGTHYDSLGRPEKMLHTFEGETITGFEYAYDRAGNPLYQRNVTNPRDSQRYSYDSAYRLASFVRGDFEPGPAAFCDFSTTEPLADWTQGRAWTIDGAGNWEAVVTKLNDVISSRAFKVSSFNEYIDINGQLLSHDDNGNRTSDTLQKYEWDAANRLRKVVRNGQTVAQFTYDAHNRRKQKTLPQTGTNQQIHWQGWLAARIDDNTSQVVVYESLIPISEALNRLEYTHNQCGHVYNITSDTFGYDPYGFTKDSGTFGYCSFVMDVETSLLYGRSRYYDSLTGRYTSRDPIGFSGGINTYSYALNSPSQFVDFYGFTPELGRDQVLSNGKTVADIEAHLIQMDAYWERNRRIERQSKANSAHNMGANSWLQSVNESRHYSDTLQRKMAQAGINLHLWGELFDLATKLAVQEVATNLACGGAKLTFQVAKVAGKETLKVTVKYGNRVIEKIVRNGDEAKQFAKELAKQFDDDCSRYCKSGLKASTALGKNIVNIGGTRWPGTAAHHIIPFGDSYKFAGKARSILNKFGIDINDARNGVFLPLKGNVIPGFPSAAIHGRHTHDYVDIVYERIKGAQTKEELVQILGEIRDDLLGGLISIGRTQ